MKTDGLNKIEKRSIAALSSVFGLRMFGLFLILPVLSIYADQLEGSSPMLMGIALGIYGMTQAIFQIPFGMMSDRYGRKPIIVFGLIIFAIGGLVAAMSDTIVGVIIGRALQGSGAIASVVLALTSDLTRENQRTKAMAFIGMSIGLSFLLALMVAPSLESVIGVNGLFVVTSILALLAIVVVIKVVPTPVQTYDLNVKAVPSKMLGLLKDPNLIRLDMGIFILHFVLTATFVVVPMMLLNHSHITTDLHWKVYVPALLASIIFMIPMVILSTKNNWLTRIFLAAICILIFTQCLFLWRPFGVVGITVCLFFFFWGFNLLEAILPSLVSRIAPVATRGSAMGVYNTFQFLGVFIGGLVGGILYGTVGYNGVFIICGLLLLVWAYLVQTAPEFKLLTSRMVTLPTDDTDYWKTKLDELEGVEESIVIENERTAYLKIDTKLFQQDALEKLLT